MFIIKDWANNHLFQNEEFDSFEDAWAFIYEHVNDDNDSTYDDYYVEEV